MFVLKGCVSSRIFADMNSITELWINLEDISPDGVTLKLLSMYG
jgi:hypothetical protein